MATKHPYLPTLDGWRAVAITGVVISHAHTPSFTQPGLLHELAPYGRLGVDIFFAISGLLICGRLLDEVRDGGIDLRSFYVRRAFRILPPYLAYLAALALLNLGGSVAVPPAEFLACLAFVRNYFVNMPSFSPYTSHFWSLAVEEHFYLLWPSILRWLGARSAIAFALVTCLLIHVWRAMCVRSPHLTALFPETAILWRTDTRLDALLWGCVGALLMGRLKPFFSRFSLTLPILIAIVLASWRHTPMMPLVYAVGFTALVLSTLLKPESAIGRFLELSWIRWVGRLSYSLYIWQTLFFSSTSAPGWLGRTQSAPTNLIALTVCAVASYYLIEKPLIAVGRRFARPRANAPAAALSGSS